MSGKVNNYQEWAKGFMIRSKKKYHPYTRKDFKFETDKIKKEV